ncbi:MAG TPA: M23 family metallopeptidase [Methylophilus sp.]
MNIILVSNKIAQAKSFNSWQSSMMIVALVTVPVLLTLLFITPKQNIKQQGVKAMFPTHLKSSVVSAQSHLDAYAKQIGELQARIMRLDAQNQRLAKLAGDKVLPTTDPVGMTLAPNMASANRGGPLVYAHPMSEAELQAAIADLISTVDSRDEYQSKIEAKVLQQSVLKDMLPNERPINTGYNSSSYGWRVDPFNGNKAFHEGLDFQANSGEPILAAADGIVTTAEHTPDYGNLVKVNHGSGLETRYAHASKLMVKAGDRVAKGQVVALVGSTGRSTGPHLHYEIRLNGNALDPRQYLKRNSG